MSAARFLRVRPSVMTRSWFAVGRDHRLVDAPGDLELEVLVGGEQGLQSLLLLVGEQVRSGVLLAGAGAVEGVALGAAVSVNVLLDSAAASVQRVAGQTPDTLKDTRRM